MGNIVLLDELTINKIAAGEVIERPASVVKELVENSIDAGANKITVEIKNGGISYIRITDNGKGFMPDDMEIAFERHATSKIREAADLETVTSMGFRGEALASIAAISHVELVSKTADNEIGKKIEVKGGNIINIEDTGCPQGSTITVTDLFYNTPVRYKFLKKDYTEAGYIEDVVTRIALVHPEISIKLINSGKVIIQTYNPDNFSIECAKRQDYELFYNTEIKMRKQLKYPPFCDIILMGFSSENQKEVEKISNYVHTYLKNRVIKENIGIILYKAIPSPIDRIKNKYRWRILIKCKFSDEIIDLINDTIEYFGKLKPKDTRITIDLNPNNMMTL